MYNLAPRVLSTSIKTTSTNEYVGPNTYVVCNPRDRKQNAAPFLCFQPRKGIASTTYTDTIYDGRLEHHIIGGKSPQNRAQRFVYKENDNGPPPGTYNIKPSWIKKKLKLDPTKPKLYVCRVPYATTCVAPSIPTKIDENGYDIDADGNILKEPPDEPEFIDLNIKSYFPGERGSKWSCRTSTRFSSKRYCTLGPGPAAHQVQLPKCQRRDEEELVREMARRLSFVPRFLEAQERKTAREDRPGPGHYDHPRPPPEMAESIYPKPFVSGAQRFKKFTADTPAPTKYRICDCYRVQKQFSTKCVPFGFEAPRFKRRNVEATPGPSDYEIKGALQEKMDGKKNRYALFEPPFNSTRERKSVLLSAEAMATPSPATYPLEVEKDSDEDVNIENISSVFSSTVERFGSCKEDGVSPTKYNLAESFKKSHCRKSFIAKKLPFNSEGPRSVTPPVKTGVPCPTIYNNELRSRAGGHSFAISPRFNEDQDDQLSPVTYNIHPVYGVATYKAWDTHNLNLKENVIRKKLRVAPRETRKAWRNLLKKKKMLKWFDVGPDFEEIMAQAILILFKDPI